MSFVQTECIQQYLKVTDAPPVSQSIKLPLSLRYLFSFYRQIILYFILQTIIAGALSIILEYYISYYRFLLLFMKENTTDNTSFILLLLKKINFQMNENYSATLKKVRTQKMNIHFKILRIKSHKKQLFCNLRLHLNLSNMNNLLFISQRPTLNSYRIFL